MRKVAEPLGRYHFVIYSSCVPCALIEWVRGA